MNIRYRLRLARHLIWRKKRVLWRTFEALIALFCLLVTHQAVWVYFQDLSDKLRREFPNPTVWLVPTKTASSDTMGVEQAVFEVDHSSIDLDVFAPPRNKVVLKVNNVEQQWGGSPNGRFKFYNVRLRRGKNVVRGELEEAQARDFAARAEEKDGQLIDYRPSQLLAPKILGAYPTESGRTMIVGITDPAAKTLVHLSTSTVPYLLYPDKYGVFQDYLVMRPNQPLHYRVTAQLEEHPETVFGDSLTLGDSLQIVTPPVMLRRTLTVVVSGDSYKVHGIAGLLQDSMFEAWVKQELITPEDLMSDYFGLALSCFNPWTRTSEEVSKNIKVSGDTLELTVSGKIPARGMRAAFSRTGNLNAPPLLWSHDLVQLQIDQPQRLRRVARADFNYEMPLTKGHVYRWGRAQRTARTEELLFEVAAFAETQTPPITAATDSLKAAATPPAKIAARNNIIQQMQRLEELAPQKVRDILTALLKTVPFLWLIWILRVLDSRQQRDYRATLYAATMAFFLFHFILLSFPVFTTSFNFIDPILAPFDPSQAVLETVKELGQIYPFLAIGAIFLFRPLYYTYKRRLPPPTLGRRVQRQFLRWFVFWPAAVLLPTLLFYGLVKTREAGAVMSAALPSLQNYFYTALFFSSIGLLCCWIFLYWLLAVGLGQPIRMRTAIKVSWAMLLLPLLPILVEAAARFVRHFSMMSLKIYPFFVPPRRDEVMWFLIVVIVGVALLSQFLELSIRLSQSRRALAFLRSRWMWALLPIFILLSLPMNYVLGTEGSYRISVSDLNTLAVGLASLLPAALLIGLITFLRKVNPHDRFELGPEAISIGTVLFAYYLSGRTASLLFAPIPLLLGWFIFTRWALLERVPVRALEKPSDLKDLVRKLLDFKQARQLSASLQRNLEKDYTQGKLSLTDLHAKTKDSQAYVAKTDEALPMGEAAAKQQIFGHGPEAGPWGNAKNALRYGLLLSIPFQLSTFIGIINRQDFANYPLLQVVNALVFSMTNWFLIAFVFGYFFHKIRGRDGFAKAFVFAIALLVATIPVRIIDSKPLLEQGFVVQIVQILAYVLLLALLAFDLRSLQKLGFTWRDLLAVHGFTTITAYGSSIVLATLASLSGKDLMPFLWKTINFLLGSPAP